MMDRRVCSGLLVIAFLSCDKSHNTAAAVVSSTSPSAAATSSWPAGARGPSERLLVRWKPPADAAGYVFADLAAVLKTDLFQRIVTSVMLLSQGTLDRSAMDCVTQWSRAVREVAAAGSEQSYLAVVSYEPAMLKIPISTCVRLVRGGQPTQLVAGVEAYEIQQHVLAVSGGTVVIGNRVLVEASLGRDPKESWPKDLYLVENQQIVFSGKAGQQPMQTNGYLSVGESNFAIHANVMFPTALAAKAAADAASRDTLKRELFDPSPFGDPQLGDKILEGWRVVQKERAVEFEFRTEGTPEVMAQHIGSVAAVGVFGFRKYLATAKAHEARVTLRAIADRIVAAQPKRLTSLPPVPKRFEMLKRGKYQSDSQDWAAWNAIGFSLTEPQYYQYRVDAARHGRGANIVAEGDLNADGRRSRFVLGVIMNPKTRQLAAASQIDERDPLE